MTTVINSSAARERDNQTGDLTEVELSKVTGGSQSSGAGAGKAAFDPFKLSFRF
jgi:hypothetical protein